MQTERFGKPAVVRPRTASGNLNRVDHEHHDHEVRGERSRAAQVETGLPSVVFIPLIVAIVESHGVVIVCQMGA